MYFNIFVLAKVAVCRCNQNDRSKNKCIYLFNLVYSFAVLQRHCLSCTCMALSASLQWGSLCMSLRWDTDWLAADMAWYWFQRAAGQLWGLQGQWFQERDLNILIRDPHLQKKRCNIKILPNSRNRKVQLAYHELVHFSRFCMRPENPTSLPSFQNQY